MYYCGLGGSGVPAKGAEVPRSEDRGDTGDAIWSYWENRPGTRRAPYLDLCLESVRTHADGLPVRVLSRDDVFEWLPDIDRSRWYGLPAPNYRSDYVRSRLLQRYGGLWIDIDTVAVAPLTRLLDERDGTGMVCWGKELGRFFGGLCAATVGSPFVEEWVRRQDEALSAVTDWSSLHYAALAQNVTWGLAREVPWKALPMAQVCPIPWFQWRRFLSRLESPRHVLSASSVTVVLWNAVMAPALWAVAREDLLSSRMLLGRLLRIGLGVSGMSDEEDAWTRLHPLSELRFTTTGQRVELGLRRASGALRTTLGRRREARPAR